MSVFQHKTKRVHQFMLCFLASVFFLLSSSFSNNAYGCYVEKYTTCAYICAGSNLQVTARIVTNANSKIRWQYRVSNGSWVCLSNGANTINGVSYTVSGASSTGGNGDYTITISNAQSSLDNQEIRIIINEAGQDPVIRMVQLFTTAMQTLTISQE